MSSTHKKMGSWCYRRGRLHWFALAVYFQTFQLVGVGYKLPAMVGCFSGCQMLELFIFPANNNFAQWSSHLGAVDSDGVWQRLRGLRALTHDEPTRFSIAAEKEAWRGSNRTRYSFCLVTAWPGNLEVLRQRRYQRSPAPSMLSLTRLNYAPPRLLPHLTPSSRAETNLEETGNSGSSPG